MRERGKGDHEGRERGTMRGGREGKVGRER